ncbi:MAG TPA: hypothetical protein VEJ45_10690 [Candidatus Acidoferrales bacterium]|nr:hypothetical protein [Candidatus Acidoferrales bacterium]
MSIVFKCEAVEFLILIACVSQVGATPQPSMRDQSIATVSLCQLTRHWEKYDHRIVRIEAIYHTSNEVSQVYDPGCPTSDQTAWVELLPYDSPSPVPPELKEKLNELLRSSGRARITVIGEFDGPKKVNVPSGLSPEAADAVRETNSRYGHMNSWKFQFVFSKVEKVEPVPTDAPWPHLAAQAQR